MSVIFQIRILFILFFCKINFLFNFIYSLIALGLEQFYQYLFVNEKIVLTPDNLHLNKIGSLINKHMMPPHTANLLKVRIKKMKWKKDNNPISVIIILPFINLYFFQLCIYTYFWN